MLLVIPVFLSLSFAMMAKSAVFIELQDLKPGEPPWCKDEDMTEISEFSIFNVGEIWYPKGVCLRKECVFSDASNNQVQIRTYSCGAIDRPQHCLVSDLSKPYPECCPKLLKCCL